jgi:glycosyltransferase involved in cell wall biosynthesis
MQSHKTNTPRISVLMPVYNAERFLRQAVDSILEQTYADFELIAIDDGSKDASGTILDEYAAQDPRVRVFHQENQGLVTTLNRAIELSHGEYLARQDGDDVSFPLRFEQQAAVLDSQPDVVLVSGGFEVFDEEDEFLYREVLPTDDQEIKRAMYLRNPIGHGSVMFRKDAALAAGLYSDQHGPTEDYELWSRLAKQGKFAAVEQAVYHWRVNPAGITSNSNKVMLEIMRGHIDRLWLEQAPPLLSAKQLRQKGYHYYSTYRKRGVDMKNDMLADNAQIAFKMMRRGNFFMGCRQLLAVALVGRSGLRAVRHRMLVVRRSGVEAIRKHALFGRQDAA